jgi:glycerate 2-kinase
VPTLVAAPDKFRGTATAQEVAAAMARAAAPHGWSAVRLPLSDGGEGLLEAFDRPGSRRLIATVTGPGGEAVAAPWRCDGSLAVVEMARASGLELAGGAEGNDPVGATSRGTGELLVAAAREVGAGGTVVLGLGGSATTDGGVGALDAVEAAGGLGGAELVGACDVEVGFVDAARLFAPQKGATPAQVAELAERLEAIASRYRREYGVDVRGVPGAGAAGGLGGAVLALGGRLRSGYRLVAELTGLGGAIAEASLVITGEGALDATSFAGKVVGGVLEDARGAEVDAVVVAGRASDEGRELAAGLGASVVSLVERFGERRASAETTACVEEVVAEVLAGR